MTTTIDSIYWDSVLSHAAYGDEKPPKDFTASAAVALESSALATAFTGKFNVLDISTTSSPTDTGFAAMVAKDKTTDKVTIAFRGTEKSKLDWASDAVGVTTGVAGDQIVDMYNYVARLRAGVGGTWMGMSTRGSEGPILINKKSRELSPPAFSLSISARSTPSR